MNRLGRKLRSTILITHLFDHGAPIASRARQSAILTFKTKIRSKEKFRKLAYIMPMPKKIKTKRAKKKKACQ